MMTENQIKMIASEILITDVYEYVKEHPVEYMKFINEEKQKNKDHEEPYEEILDNVIVNGKMEVPI